MLKRKVFDDSIHKSCIVCGVTICLNSQINMCFECQNIADFDIKENFDVKENIETITAEDLNEIDEWENNFYNARANNNHISHNNNTQLHNNNFNYKYINQPNLNINSQVIGNEENIENFYSPIKQNSNNNNINNNINNTPTKKYSKQQKITSFISPKKTFMDNWLGIEPKPNINVNNNTKASLNNTPNKNANNTNNNNNNNNLIAKESKNHRKSNWKQQFYSDGAPLKKYPFYKRVEGTNFFVDGFRFDCSLPNGEEKYFLSHFHADHYGGITGKWNKGRIICSPVTASLVRTQLGVKSEFIWAVPFWQPFYLDGIKITLLDANHCPGSCMFLFEWENKRVLHVGDFRYCHNMKQWDQLKTPLTTVYLDTTYCNSSYNFPTQDVVINHVAEIALNNMNKTLFVVGTYKIGKERVIVKLVELLNFKVFAPPAKIRVFKQLDLPKVFVNSLTSNPDEALIHIVPLWGLSFDNLSPLLKYQPNIVAFKPTGWTHTSTNGSLSSCAKRNNISIYGVPYSEHSSFTELREFVQYTKPAKIIPTVNNSSGQKVNEMLALLK